MSDRESVIRTPDQRLRVFISSTIGELAGERQAAAQAVEAMHMHPILFELGARPHPPRDLYRSYLDQSDIFIGIYWQSYGWVAPDMSISGIADEFELCGDKPKLIYVKNPAPEREPELAELLKRIGDAGVSYKKFSDPTELSTLVKNDLALLLTERFTATERPQTSRLKTKIPAPYSPLIGREREIADITKMFLEDGVRLISLTGPGGVGKSRLAIELGLRMRDQLADGAHLVMLEFTASPDQVPSAIASSLEVRDWMNASDPATSLERALKDKQMLLILDNFEQVMDAADYLTNLMFACPKLHMLVTSRSLLRLRAERNYPLQPFEVPRADEDLRSNHAVQMFMARAKRPVGTDEGQLRAIAEITRKVDGLPLAIELAAARSNLLTPVQIAARLDDTFRLLDGGPTDLPDRHKTMNNAISWSHDLLDTQDRVFFRRLSVFDSGFTVDAAAKICDPEKKLDALDRLQSLIENSLVLSLDEGLDPRFGMFKSVRAFAQAQFEATGERDTVRRAFADYFLDMIVSHGNDLRNERQLAALDLFEAEEDNLHKAIDILIEAERVEDAVRAAWAIWPFWWIRGRAWVGRTLSLKMLEACERLDAPAISTARSRSLVGAMSMFTGKHGEAVAELAQATEELEAVGDSEALGLTKSGLGLVSSVVLPERTKPLLKEAVESLRNAEEWYGYAIAMNSMCLMDIVMDHNEEPTETFLEAVAACERLGSKLELAVAQGNLAAKLSNEDPARSVVLIRKAIGTLAQGQMNSGLAFMIDFLAEALMFNDNDVMAVRMFAFSDALWEAIEALEAPATRARRQRLRDEVIARLGPEQSALEQHRGAAYSFDEGVAQALLLCDTLATTLSADLKDLVDEAQLDWMPRA